MGKRCIDCGRKIKIRKRCGTCGKRLWREQHPVQSLFLNLKQNAKRRKKEFDLTLQEFRKFLIGFDFLGHTGRTKYSLSVDRINPNGGYTIDNIQAITISENSKKKYADRQNLCCTYCIEKACTLYGCMQKQTGEEIL